METRCWLRLLMALKEVCRHAQRRQQRRSCYYGEVENVREDEMQLENSGSSVGFSAALTYTNKSEAF